MSVHRSKAGQGSLEICTVGNGFVGSNKFFFDTLCQKQSVEACTE